MKITFRCPSCNAKVKAPDFAAGMSCRCPKCESQVAVPRLGSPQRRGVPKRDVQRDCDSNGGDGSGSDSPSPDSPRRSRPGPRGPATDGSSCMSRTGHDVLQTGEKNMGDDVSMWYLPGEGDRHSGPFNTEQVIQRWSRGELAEQTLCWKEGMSGWMPMERVEPLASRIRKAKGRPARGRGLGRLVRLLVGLACLIALGAGAYYYVSGLLAVRRARDEIAKGNYYRARRLARDLEDHLFHGQEASYLWAVAEIWEYASEHQVSGTRALRQSKRRLEDVLETDAKWRRQAASDLADILADVPDDAEDALPRSLAIAELLEALELADAKALAKELMNTLRQHIRLKGAMISDIKAVKQILDWGLELASELVALVLPQQETDPQKLRLGLNLLEDWIQQEPSLREPLTAGVLERVNQSFVASEYELAEQLLRNAVAMNGDLAPRVLLEKAEKRKDAEDLENVAVILADVFRDNSSVLDELAKLYDELTGRGPGPFVAIQPTVWEPDDGLLTPQQLDTYITEGQQAAKNRDIAEFKAAPARSPANKDGEKALTTAETARNVKQQEARVWTDIGGLEITAMLVTIKGDSVKLDKDGVEYTVPVSRLSAEDRRYLRDLRPVSHGPRPVSGELTLGDLGYKSALVADLGVPLEMGPVREALQRKFQTVAEAAEACYVERAGPSDVVAWVFPDGRVVVAAKHEITDRQRHRELIASYHLVVATVIDTTAALHEVDVRTLLCKTVEVYTALPGQYHRLFLELPKRSRSYVLVWPDTSATWATLLVPHVSHLGFSQIAVDGKAIKPRIDPKAPYALIQPEPPYVVDLSHLEFGDYELSVRPWTGEDWTWMAVETFAQEPSGPLELKDPQTSSSVGRTFSSNAVDSLRVPGVRSLESGSQRGQRQGMVAATDLGLQSAVRGNVSCTLRMEPVENALQKTFGTTVAVGDGVFIPKADDRGAVAWVFPEGEIIVGGWKEISERREYEALEETWLAIGSLVAQRTAGVTESNVIHRFLQNTEFYTQKQDQYQKVIVENTPAGANWILDWPGGRPSWVICRSSRRDVMCLVDGQRIKPIGPGEAGRESVVGLASAPGEHEIRFGHRSAYVLFEGYVENPDGRAIVYDHGGAPRSTARVFSRDLRLLLLPECEAYPSRAERIRTETPGRANAE